MGTKIRNFMHNVFHHREVKAQKRKEAQAAKEQQRIQFPQQQPYREEKVCLSDGRLLKHSIFKDIDGDGKEDLYSVTFYDYETEFKNDRPAKIGDLKSRLLKPNQTNEEELIYKELKDTRTFTDFDGDGYDDYTKKVEYDKQGNIISESGHREEDINVAKQKYGENTYKVINRQMSSHYTGHYIY